MKDWISVEDRLPERQSSVIVFDHMDVVSAKWDRLEKRFYISNYLNNVTHWMPLPEPPTI